MPEDNGVATKKDLREMEERLSAATKKDIREVKRDLREMEDRLIEKMRDMQTEVLRAFHDWSRPVEIKLRTLPQLDERLGLLEERISRLERGELPPRPRN